MRYLRLIVCLILGFLVQPALHAQALNIGAPPARVSPTKKTYTPATKPAAKPVSKPAGVTARSSVQKSPVQIRWYGENTINLVLVSSEVGRHNFYIKPNVFNTMELPLGIHTATAEMPRIKYQANDFLLIDNTIFLIEFWVGDDGKTLLFQTFTADEYKQHLRNIVLEDRNVFIQKNINPLVKSIALSNATNVNFQNFESLTNRIQEMADANLVNAEERIALNSYFSSLRSLLVSYNELKLARSYKTFLEINTNFTHVANLQNALTKALKSGEMLTQVWLENFWETDVNRNIIIPIRAELQSLPQSQADFNIAVANQKAENEKKRVDNQSRMEEQLKAEQQATALARGLEQKRLEELEQQRIAEENAERLKREKSGEFYKHSGTLLGFNFGVSGKGILGAEFGKVYSDNRLGIIGEIGVSSAITHSGVLKMGLKTTKSLGSGIYATGQFFAGFYNHYDPDYFYWTGQTWVSGISVRKPMAGLGFGCMYIDKVFFGGLSWDFMSNFNGVADIPNSGMFKISLGLKVGY